jgi:hypothetical protein
MRSKSSEFGALEFVVLCTIHVTHFRAANLRDLAHENALERRRLHHLLIAARQRGTTAM